MITQEYLKFILNYNEITGIFTWENRPSNRIQLKQIAGCEQKIGYITIQINKKHYKAHRLAWLYVYGEWPKNQIDHINGIRNDNRIENLRDVSVRENSSNGVEHRNNKLIGAYITKDKKWKSQIQINKKLIYLGIYNTELEAHNAYITKKEAL